MKQPCLKRFHCNDISFRIKWFQCNQLWKLSVHLTDGYYSDIYYKMILSPQITHKTVYEENFKYFLINKTFFLTKATEAQVI